MHKLAKGMLVGFGALVVLTFAAYLLRDPLATHITAYVLDHSDESKCTHPKIRLSSSLQRVTLSPFECQMRKPGPLKSFKTESEVVLQLSGTEITYIYIPRATMDQRDRKTVHVESNVLGDLANLVGVTDGLMKGMLDASESFAPGGPIWEADTLIGTRNGKLESIMKGYRRTYEDGYERQHAARMEGSGKQLIAMRDFDMRVNKTRGTLKLALYFGTPKKGERPDMELKMEARGLDQKKPYVEMSL